LDTIYCWQLRSHARIVGGLPGEGEIAEVPIFIYISESCQRFRSINFSSLPHPVSNPITVQIFNQNFRISADLEDPEYVKQAASYLDNKMREASTSGARRPLDVAIMAAMNIAEEVLAARAKKEALLSKADQRIGDFTRLLDDQPAAQNKPQAAASDKGDDNPSTAEGRPSNDDAPPSDDGETGSPTRRF
jgi:cell division protein ZapA (FtsZ GTPase activity inhibitor)